MRGVRVKQINNIVITEDKEAKRFRAYSPNGVELCSDVMLAVVESKCRTCTDFLQKNQSDAVFYKKVIKFMYLVSGTDDDDAVTYDIYVEVQVQDNSKQFIAILTQMLGQYIQQEIKRIRALNGDWQFDDLVAKACKVVLTKRGIKWHIIYCDGVVSIEG